MMDPPVEDNPLRNGLDPAKQEREESTTPPTPQEHTTVDEEVQSTHTTDAFNDRNIEEPISVSCAAGFPHNGLQLLQVDSNDDDSAIGDLSRL
jgi:hypothetical protein